MERRFAGGAGLLVVVVALRRRWCMKILMMALLLLVAVTSRVSRAAAFRGPCCCKSRHLVVSSTTITRRSAATTISSSRKSLVQHHRGIASTKKSSPSDDEKDSDNEGFSLSSITVAGAALNNNSSNSDIPKNSSSSNAQQLRQDLLRDSLVAIGMDADGLERAVRQSLQDATAGYDGRYGRSAIRACRSFCYPKQKQKRQEQPKYCSNDGDSDGDDVDLMQLKAAAGRTARQVQFLWKRHQSHRAEWVRHHDNTTSDSENNSQQPKKKRSATFPLVLVLDNLRSAHNVGCLFRTGDAAGCAEILTVGITPHPGGSGAEKLRKSALGAESVVPTQHFDSLPAALSYLRRRRHPTSNGSGGNGSKGGYTVIGMETTQHSRVYTDCAYDAERGVALVLGNEVTGVDPAILPQLDAIVEIPMFGTKNSLNVAACAPIVLYEIIRQWNSDGSKSSRQTSEAEKQT